MMTTSTKSLTRDFRTLVFFFFLFFLILLNRSNFGLHISLRINLHINIDVILHIIDTQIDMQLFLYDNELREKSACQHTRDFAYQRTPIFAYQ